MTTTETNRRRRRFDPDPEPENTVDETAPWDDDETAGKSSRRTRTRKEDDPAPRRTRASQKQHDSYDEETGDEEADGEETVVVPVYRGRKAINEARTSGDGGSAYFKWADDGGIQVVKFLKDVEPWSYNQHWVSRQGKQSFPCIGKKCPLCEIGVKSSLKTVYTILNLSLEIGPTVQTLEVTRTIDDTLSGFDEDKKTGPLSSMWYALSRTKKTSKSGGFGNYNYRIVPIKDRDLEEDYGIPLDFAEDALDEAVDMEMPDVAQVIGKVSVRTLQEIADEAMA